MELRMVIVRGAVTFAVIVALAWGIWLVGWVAFDRGSHRPPNEGRGTPTTVQIGG